MVSKLYEYGLRGLGIGFVITNIMLYIFLFNDGVMHTTQEIIMSYIVWAVASALFGIASIVYEIPRLGILYKTALHFLTIMIVAFATTSYMMKGIFGSDVNVFTEVFPSFIFSFFIIYLILWTGFYFKEKHHLTKLNAKFK
ncbi:MAG: DUF3021 domain-containing protein [Firmicutes bacterium]|nr:DUF3021 domain-containing protein [Bacillota bacterium]